MLLNRLNSYSDGEQRVPAGLYDGNSKRATARPSTEQWLELLSGDH